MSTTKKYYRPDIDGLRALAIIPVVLFHAGVVGFSGGYVGVDIFFVISGFLITSIIVRQINNGSFSFTDFFERRVRRIFPALLCMTMVVLLVGVAILVYPGDLQELGKSAIAQSFFLSNVFFMRKDGYFAAPAEAFPLLHTWSLSVEEQFYIVFPVVLFVVVTFWKQWLKPVLLTLAVASFLLSLYMVNIAPGAQFAVPFVPDVWHDTIQATAAFYLLPTRAWELLVGAMLAVFALKVRNKYLAECISVAGVVMVIYSITQFGGATLFPGAAALLPVLGAACVISANAEINTFVKRVLSAKLLVWIGLISYSLYLWHWPIFVYGKTLFGELGTLQMYSLVIVSVIAALLSYEFVEKPFRDKRCLPHKKSMLLGGLLVSVAVIFGAYIIQSLDTSARIPAHLSTYIANEVQHGPRYIECYAAREYDSYVTDGPCLVGDEQAPVSFVLWGDSHSGEVLHVLDEVAKDTGKQGVVYAFSGCAPILGVSRIIQDPECQKLKQDTMNYLQEQNITSVLLVARWTYYSGDDPKGMIVSNASRNTSAGEARRVFEAYLTQTVAELTRAGIAVTILSQVPEHTQVDRRTVFYNSLRTDEVIIPRLSYVQHQQQNQYTVEVFAKLQNDYGVTVIDPTDVFCESDGLCRYQNGDGFLYKDEDHINLTGAYMLSRDLESFVAQAGDPSR